MFLTVSSEFISIITVSPFLRLVSEFVLINKKIIIKIANTFTLNFFKWTFPYLPYLQGSTKRDPEINWLLCFVFFFHDWYLSSFSYFSYELQVKKKSCYADFDLVNNYFLCIFADRNLNIPSFNIIQKVK